MKRSKQKFFKQILLICLLLVPCILWGQSQTIRRKPMPKAKVAERKTTKRGTNAGKIKVGRKTKSHVMSLSERKRILDNLINNMVYVEGGTFVMGVAQGDKNEMPAHKVTLSNYKICKYEVTQQEWKLVMENNPSTFPGAKRPVDNVSWYECQEFITKLNILTGRHFRLPTEAEWEYAARGGKLSHGYKYSGSNTISAVSWYYDNSGMYTHNVGMKKPNELGLYDMSGNLNEWCQDCYGNWTAEATKNQSDSIYYNKCKVVRGGSWGWDESGCRVTSCTPDPPSLKIGRNGFRLAM